MDKKEIVQRLRTNSAVLQAAAELIENQPRLLSPQIVRQFQREYGLSASDAAFLLISAELGLDLEKQADRELANQYLRPGIRCLDHKTFSEDAYLKRIRLKEQTIGRWQFIKEHYEPYELFFSDDLWLAEDYLEIPQIGFFEQPFFYYSAYENRRLWMNISPSEINTMKAPIEQAQGKTLVLGLGLGYYAYHVSRKAEVSRVDIVERERSAIDFFEAELLWQFEKREKIKVICGDAFAFVAQMEPNSYDTVFVDLWHNAADGMAMMKEMKALEARHPQTRFVYWLIDSLRSGLRWEKYVLAKS